MLTKDNKKKTFLMSAYACEPGEGSEPGVGWNWAIELAKKHNVIVITRENNRGKIEAKYSKKQYPNLVFYYCDVPRCLSFWKKGQKGVHLYYFLNFQFGKFGFIISMSVMGLAFIIDFHNEKCWHMIRLSWVRNASRI